MNYQFESYDSFQTWANENGDILGQFQGNARGPIKAVRPREFNSGSVHPQLELASGEKVMSTAPILASAALRAGIIKAPAKVADRAKEFIFDLNVLVNATFNRIKNKTSLASA